MLSLTLICSLNSRFLLCLHALFPFNLFRPLSSLPFCSAISSLVLSVELVDSLDYIPVSSRHCQGSIFDQHLASPVLIKHLALHRSDSLGNNITFDLQVNLLY